MRAVFFGFVAFVFFSTVNTERTKFGTLSGSILEMLLIVTSPGAVLAAMDSVYTASGGWGTLFFVIFVIIGNMVIYKVVLATAYRSFKSFMKGELIRKMRNRRACHTEAFELLTDDGTIRSSSGAASSCKCKSSRVSIGSRSKTTTGRDAAGAFFIAARAAAEAAPLETALKKKELSRRIDVL